ncbi:MAG: NADP-dependent oxidoreductase [Pseudomonadota bacterium]|nr:NADP-dependent oxidoreductase [Pseudomonadota bacterium]
MKAIRIQEFGSPSVMELVELDPPQPGVGEVLVTVSAASVNPIDYKIREGSHLLCPSMELPTGLGFDFSGKVIACGVGVDNLVVGDAVIGMVGFPASACSYQEQLTVSAEACVKVTNAKDLPAMAGLPLAGLTAWQAVHTVGQLQSGQRVLIHAAAGGVGSFAVQLAKAAGAYVIVTASEPKHAMLQGLGADECIDYRAAPFQEQVEAVDLVIDLVGGQVGVDSLAVVKDGGLLVTVPSATREEVLAAAEAAGVKAEFFLMQYDVEALTDMAEQVTKGELQILVGGRMPLSQADLAHETIEAGHTTGKLLLLP